MTSIRKMESRYSSSYGTSAQGHSEATSGETQPTLGDLFVAKAPTGEAACQYPQTYDAKQSLRAADQLSLMARVGLGLSALIGGVAVCFNQSNRAALMRGLGGLGGLGFVASLAALWAAKHLASQCLAQANKALALAMRAGCAVEYAGWPPEDLDRQGIWANQQGSVPVVVATNEIALVGPTRVLVEQCPKSAITVVTLAHSRDTAAASTVARSIAGSTRQAIATLSRPDDPCQVRAAMKHAMHMPQRTGAPGLVDILDLVADEAVVETTTIAMHKSGPAVIGHLGRGRAILCENGVARPLTVKHTLDDATESARAKSDVDPAISRESKLSRGLVKQSAQYRPTRAQVTFVPRTKYADAAIVLLSPELAAKLNDAEVAERLRGVAFDSPEACDLTADLVSLGRQRGGGEGLAAAVVPYRPGMEIDYSSVVPRNINARHSNSRSQTRRRLPPVLARRARDELEQPLISK